MSLSSDGAAVALANALILAQLSEASMCLSVSVCVALGRTNLKRISEVSSQIGNCFALLASARSDCWVI